MIISCFLCSFPKIRLTFIYVTIQICQLFVFLLEIEHRWYELLFVTPLIFYFLLFLPYNGLIKIKSHQEEEENNSDLYITRTSGEMLSRPDPWRFQRQSSPNTLIELDLFNINTVFPRIVSAETILFLKFKCGNYSREETIQGRKLLICCFFL